MTKGTELATFASSLNADASIDTTLLGVLIDNAKTILEEERPWVVLRKTNTSKTVTTANTWQTAIDLSTITDFSRFFDDAGIVIKLFDGDSRIDYYRLVPFDRRLEYRNVGGTCVYDENTKSLYLNGTVAFNGTLWIPYIATTPEIDLTSASAVWTVFPSRFLPILAYYAVGIYKGAVDYDDINRQMLPTHAEVLQALKLAFEKWDDNKQLTELQTNDPTEGNVWHDRAINTYDS